MENLQSSCLLARWMERENAAPSSEDYVLDEDRPFVGLTTRMIKSASTEELRSDVDEPRSDVSWQQIERTSGCAQGLILPTRPATPSRPPALGDGQPQQAS